MFYIAILYYLQFIEEVKLWMSMSEGWRERYTSIDVIKGKAVDEKLKSLLLLAHETGNNREWLYKTFDFEDGEIVVKSKRLDLTDCTFLNSLPEGLNVDHLNLTGCTSLTGLPKDLKVNYLILYGCTSLTSLPEDLEVGEVLSLHGCTHLTSLPEGLSVDILYLNDCINLPPFFRHAYPKLHFVDKVKVTLGNLLPPGQLILNSFHMFLVVSLHFRSEFDLLALLGFFELGEFVLEG